MCRRIFAFLLLILLLNAQKLFPQSSTLPDSISRTLESEEKLFLNGNFLLLAAKYEVSAADAAIIQAKLYPNPNLSIDQGAYNKSNKTWFDIHRTGETAASLQQVILLAGKRNKQITAAKINSQISLYQFYDLIRTLRFELRTSFYDLYFLQQSLQVYNKEIESLQHLIGVYTTQYQKGNIAFKELARLQSMQFNLENERIDILKETAEKQSNLILLSGDTLNRPVKPEPDLSKLNQLDPATINYTQLIDSGLVNRYDLQSATEQVQFNQNNLALQKSLRVPDLTVGLNWDRQGSYIENYNSLSLAIDLPVWNRNQGNIKMAGYRIDECKQIQSQLKLQVLEDINKAYSQFLETDKLFKSASSQFNADYEKMLDGITKGYQEHSISLLEFVDYYETYKNSKLEFIRLQNNRIDALENLFLATGTVTQLK